MFTYSVHICADVHHRRLGSTKSAKYELYCHIIFVRSHCFWKTIRSIVNSILISLNWRARQARSLTFGITLSTEQGCQYSLEKFPLSGEVELYSFFEDLSFGS